MMHIVRDAPILPVWGRGRPKGKGLNVDVLSQLNPGDGIADVPPRKMASYKASANRLGIKLRIRRQKINPGDFRKHLYLIVRIS